MALIIVPIEFSRIQKDKPLMSLLNLKTKNKPQVLFKAFEQKLVTSFLYRQILYYSNWLNYVSNKKWKHYRIIFNPMQGANTCMSGTTPIKVEAHFGF